MHGVLGLHRHVVRLIELDGTSYVIKELPDDLVRREYRLLRELDDHGLPTAEVVAAVTDKPDRADGMLVTRHLDYSIPYRTLLAGRGLTIPYLGERVLDSLVVLLVRLHLAGFFWGDCSLSNTLFRRDAGALSAYVIDMETGEQYAQLSDGQRHLDLQVATENVAGGLLDLQAGRPSAGGHRPDGRRAADQRPLRTALGGAHRRRRSSLPGRRSRSTNTSNVSTNSVSTSRRWTSSTTPAAVGCATSPAWSSTASTPNA